MSKILQYKSITCSKKMWKPPNKFIQIYRVKWINFWYTPSLSLDIKLLQFSCQKHQSLGIFTLKDIFWIVLRINLFKTCQEDWQKISRPVLKTQVCLDRWSNPDLPHARRPLHHYTTIWYIFVSPIKPSIVKFTDYWLLVQISLLHTCIYLGTPR